MNSRKCIACDIIVHRASYVKHLKVNTTWKTKNKTI